MYCVIISSGDDMPTQAEKKAIKKYLEKFEEIKLRVPVGQRAKIMAHAHELGLSLNAYVAKLIEFDMEQGDIQE